MRYALRVLILAAAYYAAGRLGGAVPVGEAGVSPVWPPAGLALVAMLTLGPRYAPGVWLGSFFSGTHVGISLGFALLTSGGSTLAACSGAWLLRRAALDVRMSRARDVVALTVLGAGVSTALAATTGTLTLHVAGLVTQALIVPTWTVWWVGDAMGVLVVAPLLFTLLPQTRAPAPRRELEGGVLALVLVVTCALVFGGKTSPVHSPYAQAFLVFPWALWGALRFGPRGAVACASAMSVIALACTSLGRGPFTHLAPIMGVLVLQMFMGIVTLSALLLAAVTVEREQMQAKLAVAERMATVGTLAAGVAHEINTPLAFIMGNLQVAARQLEALFPGRDERAEALREVLRDTLDGAERIRLIVGDLKSFSREGGKGELEVDVVRVVQRALSMASCEIRHRARVVEELGSTPPVLADEARLGQVFLNLLVNAGQSIDGPANAHEIGVRTGAAEDGRVLVEVRDTGVGIPPHLLGRIFEPFFTTNSARGGTGLGLSICHKIVGAYGGEITVDSVVGKGTTVRVLLPPALHPRAAVEVTEVERAPDAKPVAEIAPTSRGRILVIDDEIRFGKSLEMLLKGEHDLTVATSGADAVRRILAGESFDVILCDLHMPHMSGMEIHERLLEVAPHMAPRMIFITGGAVTDAAREFVWAERHRVFEKPVAPELLIARLAAEIKAPRASRRPPVDESVTQSL